MDELVGKYGNWDARNVDLEKVVSPPSIVEVKPVVEAIRISHKHRLNRVPLHKHKLSVVVEGEPAQVAAVVVMKPPVEPAVVAEIASVEAPAVVAEIASVEVPAVVVEIASV